MKWNKMRTVSFLCLITLWLGLAGWMWLRTPDAYSDSERRPLEQFPTVTVDSILSGKFMVDFEDYTLDQFPMRDRFRQLKSLFVYNGLQQLDNNGIFISQGSAAALEYPMKQSSLERAAKKFQELRELYFPDSEVVFAMVPDKSCYLAPQGGYLHMDYQLLESQMQTLMPWADHVSLLDLLEASDYYRTDTHWRQEHIVPVAQAIGQALGVQLPGLDSYTVTKVEKPFYGVYYGQAALPMEGEDMYILRSEWLDNSTVYTYDTGVTSAVYDLTKLETSKDQYDVFMSGSAAVQFLENPNARTDKELIVFRDSFGSSLIPLLAAEYSRITVLDTRYVAPSLLGSIVEFKGQDVLMMYSTLVLQSSAILR